MYTVEKECNNHFGTRFKTWEKRILKYFLQKVSKFRHVFKSFTNKTRKIKMRQNLVNLRFDSDKLLWGSEFKNQKLMQFLSCALAFLVFGTEKWQFLWFVTKFPQAIFLKIHQNWDFSRKKFFGYPRFPLVWKLQCLVRFH